VIRICSPAIDIKKSEWPKIFNGFPFAEINGLCRLLGSGCTGNLLIFKNVNSPATYSYPYQLKLSRFYPLF